MLEEGLRLDPFDWPLKQALEAATQGVLRDLVEGTSPGPASYSSAYCTLYVSLTSQDRMM